jgi:hypothetical protein
MTRLPGCSGVSRTSRSQWKGDADVGVPVDREGVPGLLLQRTHVRGRAGDQDDAAGVVVVEEAGRHGGVGGVGDFGLNGAGVVGRLGDGDPSAGHGDDRGAGVRRARW